MKNPLGQNHFSLGKSHSPLGKMKIPLGKVIFPLGENNFPSGKSKIPLGKAFFPLGESKFPLGKDKIPLGKIIFPLGKRKFPLGKTFFPEVEKWFNQLKMGNLAAKLQKVAFFDQKPGGGQKETVPACAFAHGFRKCPNLIVGHDVRSAGSNDSLPRRLQIKRLFAALAPPGTAQNPLTWPNHALKSEHETDRNQTEPRFYPAKNHD